MIIFETTRLTIRRFAETDAPFIFELMNSPGWLQFIGNRNIQTEEDACLYITEKLVANYAKQGFGFYAVIEKISQNALGMVGIIKRDGLADVDIGFAFLPQFEGQGYGFESASALLDYARKELKIDKMVAITNPDNLKSQKLLRKIGLEFERMVLLPDEKEEIMLFSS